MSCMFPTSVFSAFPIHTTTPAFQSFTLLQLSSCHFSMKILIIIAILAGLSSAKLHWEREFKRRGDGEVFDRAASGSRDKATWNSLFRAHIWRDEINYGRPMYEMGEDKRGSRAMWKDAKFSTRCSDNVDPCDNRTITFWKNSVKGRRGELRGFFCTDDEYHRRGPMCNHDEISFPELGESSKYFCCPWGFQKDNGGCQRYVLFNAYHWLLRPRPKRPTAKHSSPTSTSTPPKPTRP